MANLADELFYCSQSQRIISGCQGFGLWSPDGLLLSSGVGGQMTMPTHPLLAKLNVPKPGRPTKYRIVTRGCIGVALCQGQPFLRSSTVAKSLCRILCTAGLQHSAVNYSCLSLPRK